MTTLITKDTTMKQVLSLTLSLLFLTTLAEARTTSYTYHENGRVDTMDGPRDNVNDVADITDYDYDANGNLIEIKNPLNHITTLTDYNGLGLVGKTIDPNGVEARLSYNERGWLLSFGIVDPSDVNTVVTTSLEYDGVGNVTAIVSPEGQRTRYEYDAAYRLIAIENHLGERYEFTLDNAGNRTTESIKNAAGVITYQMRRDFDELSRVMNVIGAASQTTHYDYDANDNVTQVTDGKSNITSLDFDGLNRLTSSIDPVLAETQLEFNEFDQITQVTDARGLQTLYEYNAFGELTKLTSPDTGVTLYDYDPAGNLISSTDARGVQSLYTYDALNRLTSVTFPGDASENITFSYDATTNGNYGIGRLTGITDQSGNTGFTYDYLGNLTQKQVTLNGRTHTTAYGYDATGRMVSMTHPSGNTYYYTYDALSRIASISVQENGQSTQQTLAGSITYQPFGGISQWTYGNGVIHTMGYDQDYRVTSITDVGNASINDLSYGYDANNNITNITDSLDNLLSQTLDYTAVDQIDEANGVYGQIKFEYDLVGNRTEKTTNGQIDTYNYSTNSNQLDQIDFSDGSARNLAYDSVGNLSTDQHTQTATWSYNQQNRPTQVTTAIGSVNFVHNALGQRVQKSTNNEHLNYLYNENGQLIATVNEQGDIIEEYVWLGGTLIASKLETKPVHYHITHRPTGKKIHTCSTTNGSSVGAVDGTETGECAQWIKVKNGDYFHLQRATANHYLKPDTNNDGSAISIQPNAWSGTWTQWQHVPSDNGYGYIKNRATGKFVFLNGTSSQIQQQPSTWRGHYTQWKFEKAECAGCVTAAATSSQWVYVHNNHLDTPQTLTDDNQQVIWKLDSQTPFGVVDVNHDVDGDDYLVEFNLRFPGQYYDKETGLNYNYFRDYDPSLGRYVQSDPIGLSDGPNTYSYVHNNPLIYFDELGLSSNTFDPFDPKNMTPVQFMQRCPRKAQPHRVVNALKNIKSLNFRVGNQVYKLSHSGMKHILVRHHPAYWNGTVKAKQTFFPKSLSVQNIQSMIKQVVKQNRQTIMNKGPNATFQVQGNIHGNQYVLGFKKGQIGQFYPKTNQCGCNVN